MITDRINSKLQIFFDTENDSRYKKLVCDQDGSIPETITKPTDMSIGVMASNIEYLRRLSLSLLKQLYVDEAEGEYLEYQLEEFFDSLRFTDETDAEWVERTIRTVFKQRVANAPIIYALRQYSTQEPEISNVDSDSAYADFSFADVYSRQDVLFQGEIFPITPAIAERFEDGFYTFEVTLYDTPTASIRTIFEILDTMHAAGTSYILKIIYTGFILIGATNKYKCSGTFYSSLVLDEANSEGGTPPASWLLYGSGTYGSGVYAPSAYYESPIFYKSVGFQALSIVGLGDAGDIGYQIAFSNDNITWTDFTTETTAIGVIDIDLQSYEYFQIRFIFHSSAWSDPDNVYFKELI